MVQPADRSEAGTSREPAAFILDAVGDLSRPRAGLPVSARGLDALPGKLGLLNGIANATGWLRRGREHLMEQARTRSPTISRAARCATWTSVAFASLQARWCSLKVRHRYVFRREPLSNRGSPREVGCRHEGRHRILDERGR
jgi:hypothetical protein